MDQHVWQTRFLLRSAVAPASVPPRVHQSLKVSKNFGDKNFGDRLRNPQFHRQPSRSCSSIVRLQPAVGRAIVMMAKKWRNCTAPRLP